MASFIDKLMVITELTVPSACILLDSCTVFLEYENNQQVKKGSTNRAGV